MVFGWPVFINLMKKYLPNEIEPKWQKKWDQDSLYFADLRNPFPPKNPYYVLVELPYTSGDLHMGHWFTFTIGDVISRAKKMQGFSVVFPNGFDAFGLPAENAAIKKGIHPRDWTYQNAENMRKQFDTMGPSIDWTKTMIACDPKYYKWNQWLFLKMFEKGLAYRGKMLSNWCPNCQTVLANENVEGGKCWRCGTTVVQKEVEQWFIKITDYSDRLIWPENPAVDWPKSLVEGQNNWIGKSEGVVINFGGIEVFTTRPDTLFGATFLVISPEYGLLEKYVTSEQKKEVSDYVQKAKKKSELERKENKDKSGVFTGSRVKNPLSGEEIPVWVADYVLPGYGTGAIMAVPAHDGRDFEFAKKFGLPIREVVKSPDNQKLPYTGDGVMINSGQYNGLESAVFREKVSDYLEEKKLAKKQINYHLHDWSISRQRYWGTPIPMVHCPKCGIVPVPEKDLPVELPYEVDYAPKGKPPLATAEDWIKTQCPKCGGPAERDPETMDTFMDSSWYFFRYLDPENDAQIFDPEIINAWMPLKIYIGGAEHTLGHALYSRFVTKFLFDLGLVNFEEYALRRVHHGVILGPDGYRMSKSRGNVVNPDEQVKEYGADSVRVYLSFLGPFDIVTAWNPEGINGVYHFLQRVWGLFDKVEESTKADSNDLRIMHKIINKVSLDIEELKLNTSVAALMEWLNYLSKKQNIAKDEYKTFLLLLAPFAPHITEELWQMLGGGYSIHTQKWPHFDEKYLKQEQISIPVQVNGKLREMITIQSDILSDSKVVEELALKSPKVQKFIAGKKIKKTVYVPGKIFSIVI